MKNLRPLVIAFQIALLADAGPAAAQSEPDSAKLMKAMENGDGGVAMGLVAGNPTLVNSRDYDGNSPLLVAVAKGQNNWAAYFIGKGADVNAANRAGDTPLIVAARTNNEEVFAWLLDSKARIDQANKIGETALIAAVQQHNLKLAKALLQAGADPDKVDYSGHTARDYAKLNDRDPRFQQLFAAPAKAQ